MLRRTNQHWLTAFVAFAIAIGVPFVDSWSASGAAAAVSNGKIAFMSTRDGNPEIYTVNPDGSALTRLTHSDSGDITPAWSPDGAKIAFGCGIGPELGNGYRNVGPSDLCVMAADGTGLIRLTDDPVPDGEPTWSPDGTRIAFWRAWDIYTTTPDGTDLRRLTRNASASEPAWSPDGTRIAFVSARGLGDHEIYVMRADGTGAIDLTNEPAKDESHPSWSPDGRRIAFDALPVTGGERAVWLMNADGSGKIRLPPSPGNDAEPAWSPDGTKIAFSRYRDTLTDIFIRNVDGTGAVAVTHLPGFEQHADWQRVPGVPAASWTAAISGNGVAGHASLVVPGEGWATATFALDRLTAGVAVTAQIVAGVGCSPSSPVIAKLPGYTTTSGGTWRQRWVFGGSGLVRLRSAIRSATPLWFDLSVGGRPICSKLAAETAHATPS